MKIHRLGNDYAYQQELKQSEETRMKEVEDANDPTTGAEAEKRTDNAREAEPDKTAQTSDPGAEAEEKKVSEKTKGKGSKKAV